MFGHNLEMIPGIFFPHFWFVHTGSSSDDGISHWSSMGIWRVLEPFRKGFYPAGVTFWASSLLHLLMSVTWKRPFEQEIGLKVCYRKVGSCGLGHGMLAFLHFYGGLARGLEDYILSTEHRLFSGWLIRGRVHYIHGFFLICFTTHNFRGRIAGTPSWYIYIYVYF